MGNVASILKMSRWALASKINPTIKHLILHVTKRCNMRCSHCFVDFDNPAKELTFEEIRVISKELPELIWLDIGGGEPLSREDLEDIVVLFRFQELAIPTNGWDTELVVNKVKKIIKAASGKLLISLSLDGLEKTHDQMRQPSSFRRAIETFHELKKISGLIIKFNTVLCNMNYDEIIDLMYFVRDLNPDFHSILFVRGRPRDPSIKLPSLDKIKSLEEEVYKIQQLYNYGRKGILSRIQMNYQRYKRHLSLKILQEQRQIIPCLAGSCHLVVWSDGNVAPCELLPPVGNIRTDDLKDILHGEKMKKAVGAIKRKECYCTHDCNMMENILFSPSACLNLLL